MALPGWTREYQDIGLAAIPPAIVDQLKLAQLRYGKFADFFSSMTRFYEGRSGIAKRLVSAMEGARSASTYIGILLGSKGRTATPEEIENMYATMEKVDAEAKYIKQYAGESTRFSKILTETEKEVGVTLDQIEKTNSAMNQRLKNLGKMGLGKMAASLKKNAPELYQTGIGLRDAVFNATLGPFAGMAKLGIGTASSLYKSYKERKLKKDQMKIMTGLDPMMKLHPEELLRSVEKERMSGFNLREGFRDSDIRGGRTAGTGTRFEADPTGNIRDAFSSKPTDLKNMAMPLFTFFDKKAYDAKWTKEVIELLRKISKSSLDISKKKGSGGSGGLLGGILGGMGLRAMIGPVIATALAVLGVASIAALAGLVFSILKPKIGKTAAATVAAGPGAGLSMMSADLVSSFFEKDKNGKMKGFGGVKEMVGGKMNAVRSGIDKFFHKKKDQTRTSSSETPLVNIENQPNNVIQLQEELKRGLSRDGVNLPPEFKERMPMIEEQMKKMEKLGPQIQQAVMDSGVMDSMKDMMGKLEKTFADLKPKTQTSPHLRRSTKGSIWNLGDTLTENINSGELNQRE